MKKTSAFSAIGAATLCLLGLGASLPAVAATPPAPAAAASAAPLAAAAPTIEILNVRDGVADVRVSGVKSDFAYFTQSGEQKKRCLIAAPMEGRCQLPLTNGVVNEFTVVQAPFGQLENASPATSFSIDARSMRLDAPVVENVYKPATPGGATFVIRVAGRAGSTVEVKDADGKIAGSGEIPDGSGLVGVSIRSYTGTGVSPRYTLELSYGTNKSASVPFRSDDVELPPHGDLTSPTIDDVEVKNGFAAVTVSGEPGATVRIRDFNTFVAATTRLTDGKATVLIPDTGIESTYSVSVAKYTDGVEYESVGTPLVLNEGAGGLVPAQPDVEAVRINGARAIVEVKGDAGSVATVRDAAGTIVAVKKLGTNGTAQLTVAADTRAASELTVTQKSGAIESDPASFALEATR